jgi:hypothetical protein
MYVFRLRRWFLTGLVALMALAVVSPALADQPETATFNFTVTDNLLQSCDGFDIIENAVIQIKETSFFDKDGNRVRITAHVKYTGTLTNSATGTSVTDGPDTIQVIVDVQDGTERWAGIAFSINLPGEGIIVLDAGNIIFHPDGSLTVHGPHQVLAGDNYLCSALANV